MGDLSFYFKAFIGLFAIANPIGAIPLLLMMSSGDTRESKNRTVLRCAVAVAIILVGALWIGDAVLGFFGIGVPALRAGGGLLIVLMALSMLHGKISHAKQAPGEAESAVEKDDIAIVPLAIPLIAGPGAISLVIVDSQQAGSLERRALLSVTMLALACSLWLILRMADPIARRVGQTGLNVATRVMGLILLAIGVQMITDGLVVLMPGLGK